MSIAGVVGIAAFSFSETLSVLSLSGNSNNSAEIILQGRKKDFFFFLVQIILHISHILREVKLTK